LNVEQSTEHSPRQWKPRRSEAASAGAANHDESVSDDKTSDEVSSTDEKPTNPAPPKSLNHLLDQIEDLTKECSSVSVGDVMDTLDAKSFAPLLLLPGMFLVPPGPADVPGVPIVIGVFITFISVQLLLGQDHFWIPNWIEQSDIQSLKVKKAVDWLRKPASFMDRWSKPRLEILATGGGVYAIALVCILISFGTPIMSVIPMSSNVAGVAYAIFGLAILSRDGLLAVIAIAISLATLGLVGYSFVG
jgi:hypothetical protein